MGATRSGSARREVPHRVADELRSLIVDGGLAEGALLGRESELVQRFNVSRPSLREALRILETEGLISVLRGVRGGVVAHRPDERMTARTAALVLQARNVSLADVFEARAVLEPLAVRTIAGMRNRRRALEELTDLVERQQRGLADPVAFGAANADFHERLVALAGNKTLSLVAGMLNEVVLRAVIAISSEGDPRRSLATRRRGIRSQQRLLRLLEEGDATAAEQHWQRHMQVVGRVLLGPHGARAVELAHHL